MNNFREETEKWIAQQMRLYFNDATNVAVEFTEDEEIHVVVTTPREYKFVFKMVISSDDDWFTFKEQGQFGFEITVPLLPSNNPAWEE